MEYIFSFNSVQGIFALPCDAVDLYINEASQDDLKVLLYIFRHSGKDLNDSRLCRSLGMNPEKVRKSMAFWVSKKLLSVKSSQSASPESAEPIAVPVKPAPPKKVIDSPAEYSAAEVAKKLAQNSELKFLLEEAAGLTGKLLSSAECSTLIYLCEGAGLPADVLLMLIEYCVTSGRGNMRYIEKMGLSWAEAGISTHELAESRIRALENLRSFEGKVKSMMGVTGRALTATERQHLSTWADWELSPELVAMAYEICVNRTGKLSFSYIHRILTDWHEKGYVTPEQAKAENKPKTGNGKPTSYNIDEYVDLSMKRLLND